MSKPALQHLSRRYGKVVCRSCHTYAPLVTRTDATTDLPKVLAADAPAYVIPDYEVRNLSKSTSTDVIGRKWLPEVVSTCHWCRFFLFL